MFLLKRFICFKLTRMLTISEIWLSCLNLNWFFKSNLSGSKLSNFNHVVTNAGTGFTQQLQKKKCKQSSYTCAVSLPSSVKGGNVNRIWHHTPRHTTIQHSTLRSRIAWAAWPMRRTRRLFFILLQTVAAEARVSLVGEVGYLSISFFFFFFGKVISDFNCSSRWRFWQSLAFVNKKCFYKKNEINQIIVSNYLGKKRKKNPVILWHCKCAGV